MFLFCIVAERKDQNKNIVRKLEMKDFCCFLRDVLENE